MQPTPFPAILGRVVVVDLETSGLVPGTHGILEIGAVPLDPERESTFHREVRHEWWMEWDAAAAKVHGLARLECENHRRVTDTVAVDDFLDWLEDVVVGDVEGRAVLAGMNPRFDRDFLARAAASADMGDRFDGLVSHRTLDLHTLAVMAWWKNLDYERALFPRGLDSLHTDAIYEMLGMGPEPRPHRALEGARREAAAIRTLLGVPAVALANEGGLTPRQRARLDLVVEAVRAGDDLSPACRLHGIRYDTALSGLGLPTGGATVTRAALDAAIANWPGL